MNLSEFLNKLENSADQISFNETIETIDQTYDFTPTAFTNGETRNAANENSGSCKIFAFAKLNNFSEEQTLHCFGDYYRKDVLDNPAAEDHQNIRNFMQSGWSGINFDSEALSEK